MTLQLYISYVNKHIFTLHINISLRLLPPVNTLNSKWKFKTILINKSQLLLKALYLEGTLGTDRLFRPGETRSIDLLVTTFFVDLNQLFPWVLTRSDREGSFIAEWRARIISSEDSVFNYFIKIKDYIVKTTRSLLAEWNSRNIFYSLRKGFQVVYLFDCMKTREPWTTNYQER